MEKEAQKEEPDWWEDTFSGLALIVCFITAVIYVMIDGPKDAGLLVNLITILITTVFFIFLSIPLVMIAAVVILPIVFVVNVFRFLHSVWHDRKTPASQPESPTRLRQSSTAC